MTHPSHPVRTDRLGGYLPGAPWGTCHSSCALKKKEKKSFLASHLVRRSSQTDLSAKSSTGDPPASGGRTSGFTWTSGTQPRSSSFGSSQRSPASPRASSFSSLRSSNSAKSYATARESYTGETAEEISFVKGDRILIVRHSGDLCVGRTDFGEEGLFPSALVHLDSPASSNTSSPIVQPNNSNHSKKKSLTEIKSRMAKTVRSNASKAMSTAQQVAKSAKDVGGKAIQKGKAMIERQAPKETKEKLESSSAHHFLFHEVLRQYPGYADYFRVLMDCVIRPNLSHLIRETRKRALEQPIWVTFGEEGTVLLNPRPDEDMQWKLNQNLMESFGIDGLIEQADAQNWKVNRKNEFSDTMEKFVESFFALRELGSQTSQIHDEEEILFALENLHLPKGAHLIKQVHIPTIDVLAVNRTVVILSALVLRKGALNSDTVFRTFASDGEMEELRSAIENEDESTIESCSCEAAASALLVVLKEMSIFQFHEECARVGPDFEKAEELLSRNLSTTTLNLLVYLMAFFRLFRDFIVPVLVNILFPENVPRESETLLEDFIAILLDQFPTHLTRESAVNQNVVVVSKVAKKVAKGRITGFEKEKNRYKVRLATGLDVTIRDQGENIEWETWGNFEEVPFLAEAFSCPLLLSNDVSNGPLSLLLQFYASSSPPFFEQKLLRGRLAINLISSMDTDQSKKKCLLGTAKAIIEIFCYRGMEEAFLEKVLRFFVSAEIQDNTETLGTLFRGNSMASRVISAFIDVTACTILRDVLAAPLAEFIGADADRIRLLKADNPEIDLEESAEIPYQFVAEHARKILESILNYHNEYPLAFRQCCRICADIVESKFNNNNSRRLAVGNVVFLRFFIPALMSPEFLLPSSILLTSSILSQLKVLTASIQCLANQTSFSAAKPSFEMNELLIDLERDKVNDFLDNICQGSYLNKSSFSMFFELIGIVFSFCTLDLDGIIVPCSQVSEKTYNEAFSR